MSEKFEISCPSVFDLNLTLDCGQAFRWTESEGKWHGVAYGKPLTVYQENGKIIFDCNEDDYNTLWRKYFDLDTDYEKIVSCYDDEYLTQAVKQYCGIRILHQEPWEALCSFIISANNNIPRIKGIIDRLCENFGEEKDGSKLFPSANTLSNLTVEDLAPLRSGFRAKYIIDAAQKVANGIVDLKKIEENPIEFGREELQKINGVGAKVAECTLLYGFHKLDAFPIDVWVKRIMAELYPNGLPKCTKGTEGIAQQYLFHWRRMKDK